MKHWILASAVLVISVSASGVGRAQSDADRPHGGGPRDACAADIAKFCADIEPSGHHVMQCIRQHQDQVSDGCKSALASARGNHHWHRDGEQEGGGGWGAPDQAPPSSTPQTGERTTP